MRFKSLRKSTLVASQWDCTGTQRLPTLPEPTKPTWFPLYTADEIQSNLAHQYKNYLSSSSYGSLNVGHIEAEFWPPE